MKKITNFLTPLAVLAFVGSCLVSIFCLLVVSVRLFGTEDEMPLIFYRSMNISVFSVAIPLAGIILFAAILLGLTGKATAAIKPTIFESAANRSVGLAVKKEKSLNKAA